MNASIMGQLKEIDWRNRRVGIALAVLTVRYICAVIAFIIIY